MLINIIVNEVIFVFVLTIAITCIALEIFIPSFGLIGLAGIYLLFESFNAVGNIDNPMFYIMISVLLSVVISMFLIRRAMKSKRAKELVLTETLQKKSGVNAKMDYSFLLNKKGIVTKNLRPSGTVEIEGETYIVLSYGEFIEKDADVIVDRVEGSQVYCRKI
ncbi:MAG: NfeD family protein [Tissierellia bacterium]|nr:NfeD family protein [Tissierellia bacterium]